MSEVLLTYADPVRDAQGVYTARAVGRPADDGMWEGWIEFVPRADGNGAPVADATGVVVSATESRQPVREHLVYWATGLTPVYLEGALHRAKHPTVVTVRTESAPFSEGPAPRLVRVTKESAVGPEPVLDPFEIGARSLDVLRQELTALNRPRLFNIIAAYDLGPASADVGRMTNAQLGHYIVLAVAKQLQQRTRV